MNNTDKVKNFKNQLCNVETLVPREEKRKKIAQVIYTRQIATIVGIKTAAGRFRLVGRIETPGDGRSSCYTRSFPSCIVESAWNAGPLPCKKHPA